MSIRLKLNEQVNFKPEHFERWLYLFNETVKENFSGNRADLACARAKSIAAIMQIKLPQINQNN